jgi:signal transduction histidine kinase
MARKYMIRNCCLHAIKAMFMVALLLALPFNTHAQSFSAELSWYEDKTNQLSLEAVRGKSFSPFDKVLTSGFGKGTLWIRIHIDPKAQTEKDPHALDEALVLLTKPNSLELIELFDPLEADKSARAAGAIYPWRNAEYLAMSRAFRIPRGAEARDVWLRIQSDGTRRVEVELLTLADARKKEFQQHALFSLYLAISVLFLGHALIQLSQSPDRLVAVFVIRQIFSILVVLAATGYLQILLGDRVSVSWVSPFGALLFITFLFSAIWFEYIFISELHPPAWAIELIKLMMMLMAIPIAILLVGNWQIAFQLMLLTGALLPVLGILIVLSIPARSQDDRDAFLPLAVRWLLWIYVGRAALSLGPVLAFLGWTDFALAPLSAFMLQQILIGSIMVAVLFVRVRRQALLRDQYLLELAAERNRVLAEQTHRKDQEKMLAMLAHELKTPIAAMKMLISLQTPLPDTDAKLRSMLTSMNNVVERCLYSMRYEAPALQLHAQEVDVYLHIQNIVAQTSGPHRVLVTCPSRLMWQTDPHIFQMALNNLLDNALKYSPEASSVQLGLEIDDAPLHALRIWVENEEGPAGIPDPAHLFEKYYRNPLGSRHSGSGLGLYLASNFVKALGGSVRHQVSNGRVRFELCLPS